MTSERGLTNTITQSIDYSSGLITGIALARPPLLLGQRKDYFAGGLCVTESTHPLGHRNRSAAVWQGPSGWPSMSTADIGRLLHLCRWLQSPWRGLGRGLSVQREKLLDLPWGILTGSGAWHPLPPSGNYQLPS